MRVIEQGSGVNCFFISAISFLFICTSLNRQTPEIVFFHCTTSGRKKGNIILYSFLLFYQYIFKSTIAVVCFFYIYAKNCLAEFIKVISRIGISCDVIITYLCYRCTAKCSWNVKIFYFPFIACYINFFFIVKFSLR